MDEESCFCSQCTLYISYKRETNMTQELVPHKVKYRFFDKTFDTPYHYYVAKDPDAPNCPPEIMRDNCNRVAHNIGGTGLVVLRQVHRKTVYMANSPTEYGLEPEAD